jgi:hypothetical protein
MSRSRPVAACSPTTRPSHVYLATMAAAGQLRPGQPSAAPHAARRPPPPGWRTQPRGDRDEVFGGIGASWKGAFVGGDLLIQAVTHGPDGSTERLYGNFPDYSLYPRGDSGHVVEISSRSHLRRHPRGVPTPPPHRQGGAGSQALCGTVAPRSCRERIPIWSLLVVGDHSWSPHGARLTAAGRCATRPAPTGRRKRGRPRS